MITINILTPFDIKRKINVYKIKKLMPKLNNHDCCEFANGGGYYQWTEKQYQLVKKKILLEGYRVFKHKVYLESININHCQGIVGRYLSDSNYYELYKLWVRMMSITNLKEYGQPYYALHTNNAKDWCYN